MRVEDWISSFFGATTIDLVKGLFKNSTGWCRVKGLQIRSTLLVEEHGLLMKGLLEVSQILVKGLVEVEERMKMFSFLGAIMKGLAVELL